MRALCFDFVVSCMTTLKTTSNTYCFQFFVSVKQKPQMADQASGSGLQNIKTDQLLWDCVAVGTFQLKVIYLTNPFRRCLKLEVSGYNRVFVFG